MYKGEGEGLGMGHRNSTRALKGRHTHITTTRVHSLYAMHATPSARRASGPARSAIWIALSAAPLRS